MVRTFIRDRNAKINIIGIYKEKKIESENSWSFPISPCATSLEGIFPESKKGFLCVIIQCMFNQITKKICFPLEKILNYSLCYITN